MRITHVESFRLPLPGAEPPFAWRRGLLGSSPDGHAAVLRIGADDGASGVALATRPGMAAAVEDAVDRVLREALTGRDPRQREFLWHHMWELDRTEEFPLPLLGLVDIALWDLAGRRSGQSAWQVLGGFRTKIPAYASTATFRDLDEYLDVATQCLELGYQAIKLHAWGDARRDAELGHKLRAHVGDGVPLMYDGSAGFDLPDAVYLGRALHDAGFLWYEEPMREFNVTAYGQLARSVRIPLLVAETSDGAHMNTADFIAAGAATFGVRASATMRAGITGAMRTAHLADAYRLRAEVLGDEIPSRHLAMAISNTTYYESLITANPVRRRPEVDADGFVHAPTGPGIALPAGLDYPSALEPYVET
ncbi:enolase C-terminal domain-like protein [Kutzneria buriramensis]|uniref:enolase C-terminal domain-like protein n=1 Tax=Kutzneria buriramensis TaxID=1045776 RepID=UPI000E277C70|nr:enolase C-terminal domain-like protein [Kutzneria buriramensis]